MRIKSIRSGLMAITGTAGAMIAGVAVWGWLGEAWELPELEVPATGQLSTPVPDTNEAKSTMNFDGLWNLTLQEPRNARSSEEPPAVAIPQTVAGFGIKLVGTVIEPTQSLALFRDDRGSFDLKGVGQPLDLIPPGVQVTNIEADLATLLYQGREWRLELAAGTTGGPSSMGSIGGTIPTQPADQSSELVMGAAPPGMMMPMNPADAVPTGEEDIFAPLPPYLDPTLPIPVPPPPAPSMEFKS